MPQKILKKKSRADKVGEYTHAREYVTKFNKVIIVGIAHVTSDQFHQIRRDLRGMDAHLLIGKKTTLRTAIKEYAKKPGDIASFLLAKIALIKEIKGNCGFIFTNGDLAAVKNITKAYRVNAPARVGAISPVDVTIPCFNTGCPPDDTKFFQAIGLQTKIVKGTIEITQEKQVLTVGAKVDPSIAALLLKLNINPFFYGLTLDYVFDNGQEYDASILDLDDSVFEKATSSVVGNLNALALGIGYPTAASFPSLVTNAFKNLIAASVATDYSFDAFGSKKIIEDIKSGKVQAAAAAAPAKEKEAPKETAKEAPKAEAKPAKKKSSSGGGLGGLFD